MSEPQTPVPADDLAERIARAIEANAARRAELMTASAADYGTSFGLSIAAGIARSFAGAPVTTGGTGPDKTPVDCRSPEGITAGLVDSIITAAHVLATRDLTPDPAREALADLRDDPDVAAITGPHVAPAPASPVPADDRAERIAQAIEADYAAFADSVDPDEYHAGITYGLSRAISTARSIAAVTE